MSDLVYLGGVRCVKFCSWIAALFVVGVGCGGELEDNGLATAGAPSAGGTGGNTASSAGQAKSTNASTSPSATTSTSGSTTKPPATSPTIPTPATAPTMCFGVVPVAGAAFTAGFTSKVGPVDKGAGQCLFSVPMAPNMRLVPELVKLYFELAPQGKLEIPYVGAQASCPATGTAGGWYVTNVSGGASSVGLCGCTCAAAKKYPVTIAIAKAGLPL